MLKCPCCPYVARCQGWLRKHALVHDVAKYACHLCGRRFKTVSNLNLHLREYHSPGPAYHCALCEFATQRKRALDVHLRLHSDEKPYACPHCLFRAKRKFEISLHVQSMHTGRPRRKRREETVANTFNTLAVSYRREQTVTFDRLCEHRAKRRSARVDFVLDKDWGAILFEVDEAMHAVIPVEQECARMLAIIAVFMRAGLDKKLLIVRYNPDAFTQKGHVNKPTAGEREDAIRRALGYVPEGQVAVLYLFYRRSVGSLPDVVHEASYDAGLRQYVVPAETALCCGDAL